MDSSNFNDQTWFKLNFVYLASSSPYINNESFVSATRLERATSNQSSICR